MIQEKIKLYGRVAGFWLVCITAAFAENPPAPASPGGPPPPPTEVSIDGLVCFIFGAALVFGYYTVYKSRRIQLR